MIIRFEAPDDDDAIRSVVRAAFGQDVEADLVDALRAAPLETLSFVAELDGAVIGHIMCTPSLLDAPLRLVDVLAVCPLAVAHALREAEVAGYPLVFLEGDWSYYSRLGFRRADALGFCSPSLRIPARVPGDRPAPPRAVDDRHVRVSGRLLAAGLRGPPWPRARGGHGEDRDPMSSGAGGARSAAGAR